MTDVPQPLAAGAPMPVLAPRAEPKWTRLPLRTRPHRNPLAENDDDHPANPTAANDALRASFGESTEASDNSAVATVRDVEVADIGCAFGGMLFALAPHFPDAKMLGLEIRPKVVSFAQEKVVELRANANSNAAATATTTTGASSDEPLHHHYRNVWFEPVNVMKYGTRYFSKGQLTRLFFCHPDPHWKTKNIRRRIISPTLVHTYAYWLREGGLLYTVSDVPELEDWMRGCLDASPLFKRLTDAEMEADRIVLDIAVSTSEDAKRAERKKLPKNFAVHRRIAPPPEP